MKKLNVFTTTFDLLKWRLNRLLLLLLLLLLDEYFDAHYAYSIFLILATCCESTAFSYPDGERSSL